METTLQICTPPPWEWYIDGSGRIYLGTPHSGRLIVMDFVRAGMQGAAPRFARWNGERRERIMVPATPEALATHPDALVIKAAPGLLAAAKRVLSGLNARIDAASAARKPVPVFDGIAELHDAIGQAEPSGRVAWASPGDMAQTAWGSVPLGIAHDPESLQ